MLKKGLLIILLLSSVSFASINLQGIGQNVSATYNFSVNTFNTTEIYNIYSYIPLLESEAVPSQIISTNETNKTYPINIKTFIPGDISPQTIQGKLEITSDDYNEKHNITISVLSQKEFSVSENKNLTLNTGESILLNFSIFNKGNEIIQDRLILKRKNKTLKTQNISVPKFTNKKIFYDLNIPLNNSNNFNLSWKFKNKTTTFNVNVLDNIKPEGEVINLKESYDLAEDYTFYVETNDNVGVKDVKVKICNKTFESIRQGNTWETDFSYDIGGQCKYNVVVEDISNNTINLTDIIVFEYFKNLSIPEVLSLPKTKTGEARTTELFHLRKRVQTKVTLEELQFVREGYSNLSNNPEEIVDLVLKTREIEKILKPGSTADLELFREVDLMIESKQSGAVNFILKFDFPETFLTNSVRTIDIEGEFGRYTVPEPWSGKIFGIDSECVPLDEGSFSESKYQCIFQYPITTRPDKLNVPCTEELKNSQQENFNNKLEEKNSVISLLQIENDMNLFLMFNVLAAAWFLVFIYPRARFKFK